MSRIAAVIVFAGAVFAASVLNAQDPQTNASPTATAPSACPTTDTLDDLIKAVDAAVSGQANKDRTCFRDLFAADARLIPVGKSATGSYAPRVLTVDNWINLVAKRGTAVFYEKQVKVKTETFGHIAHLWSTYETRTTPDGKPEARGINSIQAVNDGTRWKVIEILWQAETPAEPVPEKYLP